jgi:hypothetical protein
MEVGQPSTEFGIKEFLDYNILGYTNAMGEAQISLLPTVYGLLPIQPSLHSSLYPYILALSIPTLYALVGIVDARPYPGAFTESTGVKDLDPERVADAQALVLLGESHCSDSGGQVLSVHQAIRRYDSRCWRLQTSKSQEYIKQSVIPGQRRAQAEWHGHPLKA